MFDICSGSFGQVVLKVAPQVLHTGVVFKLARRLDILNAVFGDSLCKLVENHGIYTFVLVFLVNGDEQQVESVILFKSLKHVYPTEGEKRAFGFLHGL